MTAEESFNRQSFSSVTFESAPTFGEISTTTNVPAPEFPPSPAIVRHLHGGSKTRTTRTVFLGVEILDSALTPAQIRILAELWRRCGADGDGWPSIAFLAEQCLVSVGVVKRTLRELEQLGAVRVSRTHGRVNHYSMVPDWEPPSRGKQPRLKTTQVPRLKTTHPPRLKTTHEDKPIKTNPQDIQKPAGDSPPPAKPEPRSNGCSVDSENGSLKKTVVERVRAAGRQGNPCSSKSALLDGHGIDGAIRELLSRCEWLELGDMRDTLSRMDGGGARAGAKVQSLVAAVESAVDKETRLAAVRERNAKKREKAERMAAEEEPGEEDFAAALEAFQRMTGREPNAAVASLAS